MKVVGAELVREWTTDEIHDALERLAHERLGVDAATLAQAYQEGRAEDSGDLADFLALAFLLPEDDPLFVPA